MNNRDKSRPVDSDRTEGSAKQMGGSIKEKAGSLMGDEKMKREGQASQAEGKLQNSWGSIKDTVRGISGTDSR